MTPFVRSRFLPAVENTGRVKRTLDVLLWMTRLAANDTAALDEIEILRQYLASIKPPVCTIRLHVHDTEAATVAALQDGGISAAPVPASRPQKDVQEMLGNGAPAELIAAATTARAVDADIVVVNEPLWFQYVEEFDKLHMLLADTGVLQRQCEFFVRGHDVPWAFEYMSWDAPWTGFYHLAELRSFRDGIDFLNQAQRKNLSQQTVDTTMMLVHNRLPSLCFTRDRLIFYDIQQSAAKRAGWKRQNYSFETAYYLNYYYFLLYGGFDHVAQVVNGALGLGLAERSVGATYDDFLQALQARAPDIYAIFVDPEVVRFIKTIGPLRHLIAHRGAIRPGPLYETPEREPTIEELDADIEQSGQGGLLTLLPAGELRDQLRDNLRSVARVARYKQIADGIVPIELDGEKRLIRPMTDVEWNFDKFHSFLVRLLKACAASL